MQTGPPAYPIESVDRALQLIDMLRMGERVSVKTAAERLGVAASTAHRLFGALCYRDYAIQQRDRTYSAGPALKDGSKRGTAENLRRHIRPALDQLHEALDETTHLMVLEGSRVRFIDGVESQQLLRVGLRIGSYMPAYCSAGGKALLAELPVTEVDRIHRGGLPPWPHARVATVTSLKRHLAAVRSRGYGTNNEETEQGVCGVGACIRDNTGYPIAAIALAIPSPRFTKQDIPRYADEIMKAAELVSRLTFASDLD